MPLVTKKCRSLVLKPPPLRNGIRPGTHSQSRAALRGVVDLPVGADADGLGGGGGRRLPASEAHCGDGAVLSLDLPQLFREVLLRLLELGGRLGLGLAPPPGLV